MYKLKDKMQVKMGKRISWTLWCELIMYII